MPGHLQSSWGRLEQIIREQAITHHESINNVSGTNAHKTQNGKNALSTVHKVRRWRLNIKVKERPFAEGSMDHSCARAFILLNRGIKSLTLLPSIFHKPWLTESSGACQQSHTVEECLYFGRCMLMSTNGKQKIQYVTSQLDFTRAAPIEGRIWVEGHPSFSFVYTIMLWLINQGQK